MFNTTIVRVPEQRAPVVNVKVDSPNAVDAARLHGEIREAVLAEALDATIVRVGAENHLNVAVLKMEHSFPDGMQMVRLMFSVNDKNFDVMAKLPTLGNDLYGQIISDEIAKKLVASISDAIYMNSASGKMWKFGYGR
jgi:hypothetical protein